MVNGSALLFAPAEANSCYRRPNRRRSLSFGKATTPQPQALKRGATDAMELSSRIACGSRSTEGGRRPFDRALQWY